MQHKTDAREQKGEDTATDSVGQQSLVGVLGVVNRR